MNVAHTWEYDYSNKENISVIFIPLSRLPPKYNGIIIWPFNILFAHLMCTYITASDPLPLCLVYHSGIFCDWPLKENNRFCIQQKSRITVKTEPYITLLTPQHFLKICEDIFSTSLNTQIFVSLHSQAWTNHSSK